MPLRFLILAALTYLLAACGEIPRPFAQDRPALTDAILTVNDSAGIYVEPVQGTAPGQEPAVAEAMAESLRSLEILANAQHAGKRNYHLLGDARDTEIQGETARVSIAWTLKSPDGIVIGQDRISLVLPLAAWQQPDAKGLARSFTTTATKLAGLLQDDPASLRAVAPTAIVLRMAEGAPSDGDKLLPRTLQFLMKQKNYPVTLEAGKTPAPAVQPVVMMSPAQTPGFQHIAIHWRVFNADGGLLGSVDQENDIPTGSLDRSWGELAGIVAQAAVGDILKLLDQATLKAQTKL